MLDPRERLAGSSREGVHHVVHGDLRLGQGQDEIVGVDDRELEDRLAREGPRQGELHLAEALAWRGLGEGEGGTVARRVRQQLPGLRAEEDLLFSR